MPAGGLGGLGPAKTEINQIEFVDKEVNRAHRVVFVDPVFQSLRE